MPTEYFCVHCGTKLLPDEHPCPQCSKEGRKIETCVNETIGVCDNLLRAKLERPGIPGDAYEVTQKKKISGETKRPADETMIIDRTNSEKTTKRHIVDEHDGEKTIRCHDEMVEYKAKHRKMDVND